MPGVKPFLIELNVQPSLSNTGDGRPTMRLRIDPHLGPNGFVVKEAPVLVGPCPALHPRKHEDLHQVFKTQPSLHGFLGQMILPILDPFAQPSPQ